MISVIIKLVVLSTWPFFTISIIFFLNYCFTVGKSVIYQCRRNHRARNGKSKI